MARKKDMDLDEEENVSEEEKEKEPSLEKVHHLVVNHETWKKLMILKLQTDKEFDQLIQEAVENMEG
jgi:hypothetical protein